MRITHTEFPHQLAGVTAECFGQAAVLADVPEKPLERKVLVAGHESLIPINQNDNVLQPPMLGRDPEPASYSDGYILQAAVPHREPAVLG